jgi:signal transduction protein with GAF and PtsI domain
VTTEESLTRAVAGVRSLFGAAACSCAVVDDEGSALVYVAADGVGATEIVGVRLPVGRGIAGFAALAGQPLAVRDVASDPRFARDVAEQTHYVPTSILVAPMFDSAGDVLGVVSVLDPTVDAAADWTLAVLGTSAALLGQLVDERRDALSRTNSNDGSLEALGRAVLAAVADHQAGENP